MAIAAALCLAAAPNARAQPATAERPLSHAITVPPGGVCLTAEALHPLVGTWLGRDAIDARLSVLVERPDDERTGVGFVVLRGEAPVARRRFEALPAECSDRRAALSLAISIAIDATVLEDLGVVVPAAVVVPEPPPAAPREPPPRPEPGPGPEPRPVTRPVHVAGAVGARATLSLLPDPSPAGTVALELGRERWALALGVLATGPVRAPVGPGRASLQLVAGHAGVCGRTRAAVVALEGCAGVSAGAVAARGRGFDEGLSPALPWVAATARVAARAPATGPVSVRLALDGHLALARPRLTVDNRNGEEVAALELPLAGGAPTLELVITFR